MVKIQEVAERAGVSLTTVSHVINHRERVSPALRERVDPSAALMQKISSAVRAAPNKRVVFAEGDAADLADPDIGRVKAAETAIDAIRARFGGGALVKGIGFGKGRP